MNERRIARIIFQKWLRSDIAAHNAYIFRFESDIIALKPSGLLIEYEIKLSVSDFRADFKKNMLGISRHQFLTSGKGANRFYYVIPREILAVVRSEIPAWAGIISVHNTSYTNYEKLTASIERAPKQLHGSKFGQREREKIIKAMYWKAWYNETT